MVLVDPFANHLAVAVLPCVWYAASWRSWTGWEVSARSQ